MQEKRLKEWQSYLEKLDAKERIRWAIDKFGAKKITFASSLGLEDQIITHLLLSITKEVEIFTLDTGRLFHESYLTMEKTEQYYAFRYRIYFSERKDVENMVNEKGINLFYDSVENRKLCCYIRKVKPLSRALKGRKCWICGLRREQALTRNNIEALEWDEVNKLYKLNPLYDWTMEMVWNFIKQNRVPYNKLHNEGFISIGCAPCTRAIKEGEDIRAGRWWWENPEHKECGLHKR
ncbi:MAG: phosphoadenylyl-sulfate reductase [Brevinematia bacterium]